MKKFYIALILIVVACFQVAVGTAPVLANASEQQQIAPGDFKIVMIVKQSDSWFDDMATGIEQLKKDTGLNVSVQVPETGDAASQIAIMENLIAQGVDAICIVPNDPEALLPTIQKARDAGIVVVTHEAPGIADSVDLDIEAFVNEDFGELFGENLAAAMGGKGAYVGFVGGLTMETHMAWYNAAVNYIAGKYPEMKNLADEPFEDKNSVEGAYNKTLEILKAYPEINGFFDCSAHGGGISQALSEKGKANDIKVVSLALPSMSATYLKDGSMQHGQAWRPADAGYATCYAAYLIASGQGVETGSDLKATGYDNINVVDNIAYGFAPLEFTADNIDDYNF
ncbi:sugar ABC transporter substrate-binding protein [Anaerolineaceae bacterium oral taxon 439]|nr:sugar ABC transporter substrate-binding protein [Anaerolineaceae bacterium oral taxon 439]